MTWDDVTLESPSHNAANAGTMLRLPTASWRVTIRDASPQEVAVGEGEAPVKTDNGAYTEVVVVSGQITEKNATDTNIWDATIIEGTSRTALLSMEHFYDFLETARKTWWEESASGTWHDDGNPARTTGLCRLRVGFKENGTYAGGSSLVPRYFYGYVVQVDFGTVVTGMKTGKIIPYTLTFAYASVESTA